MFEWLNKQGVRSRDGFEVQCISRYEMEYREGHNVLTLNGDIGKCSRKACFILDKSSINYWNNDIIKREFSEEKKQKILNNFIDAMAFQNIYVSY